MDLKQIELRCQNLSHSLKTLSDEKDFAELMVIIHKPGWTTPAEALFVTGLLDSMSTHVQHLTALKQTLLSGARAVATRG
ncbi:MAG TPA: hypothetical protein VKU02_09525 [Gemmataceae bacterium]|nr:hypothetical protein [Gemmataceae bacterium]